ncbi:MAG: hypothetical protein PHU69_12625 [Fermentimonas sp.]|nr:hypothetical protein [Fermentimonas sp.]
MFWIGNHFEADVRQNFADVISNAIQQGYTKEMLANKSNSLDDARDYIKALAPWINDDQIEYDSDMNPVGVSGAHTPFPPFHWKCRTVTIIDHT